MKQKLLQGLHEIRTKTKKRNFTQTLELQIKLKDHNNIIVQNVILPYKVRLKLINICFFANYKHSQEANELGIMSIREDNLKNLKNDKILLKNLMSIYDVFFCSDTIIKKLPRLIGPELYKKGKYPEVIHTDDNIQEKINIEERKVKWKFKSNNTQNIAVGNESLTDKQLMENILCALYSLQDKIDTAYIKYTMGPSVKII
tara:strand:- start:10 stop:612 length:603 start_codon:yes stop_codon:yes gene_type:complete